MFEDNSVIKLKHDIPDQDLKAGSLGTVVMVYPDKPQAYEVEFSDSEGITIALVTLQENEIELVSTWRN